MPRRQIRYPEKPHRMAPEIEQRFRELIAGKKPEPKKDRPRWQLWRWDNLRDCPELNEQ